VIEGRAPLRLFEFEAFGTAVGSAVVCGALSVLVPTLIAPTATLAALAVAGWLSLARRRGSLSRNSVGLGPIAALCLLGGAAVGFLVSPPALSPFRGLLLAGGLVPLFAVGRARPAFRVPVFSHS
jgi:hypothetical protein